MQVEARQAALRSAEEGALDKQRSAVSHALEDTVPAHELSAAQHATTQADERASKLEADKDELVAQVDTLSAELARSHNEVAELHDVRDTSLAAIAGLEKTLAKIEKQVNHGHGGYGGSEASGGQQADVQLASLSRQIVAAKLAEADAQRKLRVSARQELEHRQRLAAQAERISSLKESTASLRAEVTRLKGGAGGVRCRSGSAGGDHGEEHATRPSAMASASRTTVHKRGRSTQPRVSFEDEQQVRLRKMHLVCWCTLL